MKTAARRAAHAMMEIVREMNEAQHLAMVARTAMDSYIPDAGTVPDTYEEFLIRTSGVLRREPSARQRERRSRHIR
jgi:predicted SnoaL-like aldol condensation-catalyzing enzyme